jgi:hypothetical protein
MASSTPSNTLLVNNGVSYSLQYTLGFTINTSDANAHADTIVMTTQGRFSRLPLSLVSLVMHTICTRKPTRFFLDTPQNEHNMIFSPANESPLLMKYQHIFQSNIVKASRTRHGDCACADRFCRSFDDTSISQHVTSRGSRRVQWQADYTGQTDPQTGAQKWAHQKGNMAAFQGTHAI